MIHSQRRLNNGKGKKIPENSLAGIGSLCQYQIPFMPEVENLIIADTKNHHYQLVRMGWYEDRHVHYTVFHFDILEDKIWIQENRTDVKIDEELIEAGIAREDIFSGMMHPEMRRLVREASA